MPVPMQKFREAVFQMLYSHENGCSGNEENQEFIMNELAITKKSIESVQKRVLAIREHLNEIDAMIAKTSHSYAFERIQTVERNVLRLSLFELFFDDTIPPKVALAEAMRLTRKFGTKESSYFVNAILDALYKSSLGEHIDSKSLLKSAEELIKSEQIASEASLNPQKQDQKSDLD